MDGVPVVAAAASFAAQVGADAPRAEHHGPLQLVLVFDRLRHRSPAAALVRHRPDELAVAVPAAFADVHLAADPQRLGTVLGRRLAEVLLELLRIAEAQILELVEQVLIDDFFGRLLRQVAVHQDRHDRVREEREQEEPKPADQQDARFIFKHGAMFRFR